MREPLIEKKRNSGMGNLQINRDWQQHRNNTCLFMVPNPHRLKSLHKQN